MKRKILNIDGEGGGVYIIPVLIIELGKNSG